MSNGVREGGVPAKVSSRAFHNYDLHKIFGYQLHYWII